MAMSLYTQGNVKFGLLCRLLIDAGTVALSDFLEEQLSKTYPSKTLEDILNLPHIQRDLSLVPFFNEEQLNLLYPQSRGGNNIGPANTTAELRHLDISLIWVLLRNIAGVCPAHWKVWDNPQEDDASSAANIARIRIFRNLLYGLKAKAAITSEDFDKTWNDIVHVLLQVSTKFTQQDYDALRSLSMDADMQTMYGRMIEMWSLESSLTKRISNRTKKIFKYFKLLPTEHEVEHLPTVDNCRTLIKTQIEEITRNKAVHGDQGNTNAAQYMSQLATEKEKPELEFKNVRELLHEHDSKRAQESDDIHTAILSAESSITQNLDKRTEQLHHCLHQLETDFSKRFGTSVLNSGTTSYSKQGTGRNIADRLRPKNLDFKGREMLLHEIKQKLDASHRVTVYGLGGIGKTTLVTEYAHLNSEKYTLIRWIDADEGSFQSSLIEFADDLGIETQEKTNEVIGKEIFQRIKALPSWLLIFDNATDYENIKSALPTFNNLHGMHDVLITSRNPNWKSTVRLDIFTEDEAIAFVKQVCGETSHDKDCTNLSLILDYFPLALAHATQYIKQHCISVQTYIEIYESNKIKLLSTGFQLEDDSQQTVMSTWSTTEEKIKEKSEDATKLLQWCAFLSPDNIPLKFFETPLLLSSKLRTSEAVFILLSYSMISPSSETDCIKVHRLVQFVICKLSSDQPDYAKQVLKPLMDKLTDETSAHASTPELAHKIRTYFPHIRVLLSHITDNLLLELFDTIERLMFNTCCRLNDIHQPHEGLLIGKRLLQFQEKQYGSDHVKLVNTQQQVALSMMLAGDVEGSVQLYETCIDITVRHYGNESVEAAKSRRELVGVMRMSVKKHEAIDVCCIFMPVIERHFENDSIDMAESKKNMGLAMVASGDPRGALEIYREIMPVYERILGKNMIDIALLQVFIGTALRHLGNAEGARDLYEQAISTGQKHYCSKTSVVAQWQEHLANILEELGNSQDAYDSYKRIIPIYQAHFGENHYRVARAQINMASTLNSLGDPDGAITLVQHAQPVVENNRGKESIRMAVTYETKAQALHQQGHLEDAVTLFKKSISISETRYHPNHVIVARTLHKLSLCLQSLGRCQEAKHMIQRAYSICEVNRCEPHYPIMVKILKFIQQFCSDNKEIK